MHIGCPFLVGKRTSRARDPQELRRICDANAIFLSRGKWFWGRGLMETKTNVPSSKLIQYLLAALDLRQINYGHLKKIYIYRQLRL